MGGTVGGMTEGGHNGPTAAIGLYDGWGNERKKRDFDLSFKGHIVVLHKNTKKEIFSKKVEFCKKKIQKLKIITLNRQIICSKLGYFLTID